MQRRTSIATIAALTAAAAMLAQTAPAQAAPRAAATVSTSATAAQPTRATLLRDRAVATTRRAADVLPGIEAALPRVWAAPTILTDKFGFDAYGLQLGGSF